MTIPNDYVSKQPGLNDIELTRYKKDGYIIPDWRFSDDDVHLMQGLVEEIIKLNPDHQQEQFVCPHLPKGATKPMNSSRHRDFLHLATASGLRTVLNQIIGKDILLWGTLLERMTKNLFILSTRKHFLLTNMKSATPSIRNSLK